MRAAPAQTRIFGVKIGVDPKILVGGLIVLAGLIFWYNSRSDEDVPAPAATSVHHDAQNSLTTAPASGVHTKSATARRANRSDADRGTLRLRPIDPTRGDVDPTLRLDLLVKLQTVQAVSAGRSLFEVGPAPLSPADQKLLSHPPVVPKVTQASQPITPTSPAEMPLNVPLKYYGFVKPGDKVAGTSGLFLDGDNVVVGAEGEVVMKHYLVVALTPTTARIEDTELKKSATLNVVPAATP